MKNKYSLNQLSKKLSDWQWESKQQNNAGIQVLDLFCGAGGCRAVLQRLQMRLVSIA